VWSDRSVALTLDLKTSECVIDVVAAELISTTTHVAGATADCKEIDILDGRSGCAYRVQNRAVTCFHGVAQIALIQLIRTLPAIERAFQMKMAMINIALGEPNQWVRGSDTGDPRMVH